MNSLLNSDVGEQPEPGTKCYGGDLGGNIFPVRQKGVVTKRPGWVWLICIVNCGSVCLGMRLFYLIFSGSIPLIPPNSTITAFPLDAIMVAINLTVIAIATVLLFLLRRQCVPLFGARLILLVLETIWQGATKDTLAALPKGGGDLIVMAILLLYHGTLDWAKAREAASASVRARQIDWYGRMAKGIYDHFETNADRFLGRREIGIT